MAEPIDTQVQELGDFLQRYRERGVHPVLWVGAGASAAAGYPTLSQLEQLLRAQLPGVNKSGFDLIDAFIAQYSEADLILELQRHIAQPRPFVPLHEALARLAGGGVCPLLLTTNYDRLIESALSAAGIAFVSQTLEANFILQALDTVQILKLHGDVGDWEHAVLTAASYAEFQRAYPLLQQQLNLHLRTRPVIFVGCSMRDPRLLDWLDGLSAPERRRLFASRVIITAHDWNALPPDTQALLDSANVKPIIVPQHDSVTRLLTQVATRLVPPTARELVFDLTPGETDWTVIGPLTDSPPHTVPNPLVDADFITLLQELREWSSRPLRLDDPMTPTVRARLDSLARQIGTRLTDVLCAPAARTAVARRIHAIDQGRARLTLRVAERGPRGDQALALPWELLMPEDGTFAVHAGQLDVVREAVTDGAPTLTAPTAPLTVAVTIAAPEGQAALNYEQEAFRLYAALAPLGHQVAFSDLGTVEDLITVVEGQRAAIIHFSGHGLPGKLAFENDAGFANVIEIEALLRQLRLHLSRAGQAQAFPRLFYLASCHGATGTAGQAVPADAGAPSGASWPTRDLRSPVDTVLGRGPSTAATLHRSGFVQVVGYYGPIGDELCTRTEEAFYRALAGGETTLQAVAEARARLDEPLMLDGERFVYPLGWVQLALYHRGPDLPLALAGQAGGVHPPTQFTRRTVEVSGLPVLEFGFIGHRPLQHEVRRRLRSGQRLIVLQGLGGLGKTALASQILSKVLAPGQPAHQLILPCARLEHYDGNPIDALTAHVIAHGHTYGLQDWETQVQALEAQQLAPVERFAAVLAALWRALPALIVYADNVESLQEGPAASAPDAVGVWKPLAQGWWQSLAALAAQGLTVLASTRYVWPELDRRAWIPMSPMSRADVLRMIEAFDTLAELPRQVKMQLATRVDGHPRTIEILDALITQRLQTLGLGYSVTDPWHELVEPVFPVTATRISADLLLDVLWERLTDAARAHASRLSVLRVPAPRLVVDQLGQATDELIRASVLTRHREQGLTNGQLEWTDRWGLHSIVKAWIAAKTSEVERCEAHMAAGLAYEQWVRQPGAQWSDQVEGIQHLHAVGAGDSAWPMVQGYVLWLRGQGRYREALALLEGCEAAGVTGKQLSVALALVVQMRRNLGNRAHTQVQMLEQALTLAETDERRGTILHELGSMLHAQGDLPGARARLERALAIEATVFGTEEHPSVAASLHALAGVLHAQGDLPGARARLERALAIGATVFGTEEHPSVAASLHELARVLHAQGDLPGARARLERALAIGATVFGTEEHPSVATSLHELARVLQAQGDLPGARARLERALAIKATVFGTEEHPDVATSLHELAVVLQAQGDLPGARARLERALAIQATVFGTEEHPSVAASLHALAVVLQAQGDLPGARARLERVLAIEAQLYGSRDHYSTALSETNLGLLMLKQGDTSRAVELLSHAYQVFYSQLGPEHPHTQSLARFFADSASATPDPVREATAQARAAAQRGDLSAAIEAQERAVAHLRSSAADDRDTLVSLSVLLYNLAGYYGQAERWHDAVIAFTEVAALDEQTGHEDSASDRAALEQARRMAAATPEERSRLEAAADPLAQIQTLADQTRDAAIAVLRGELDRDTLLPMLDQTAASVAADEPPDAPWAQLAAYLQAVAAILRKAPALPVPAAFAAHLAAIEAARGDSA